jgi:hypothetical protein
MTKKLLTHFRHNTIAYLALAGLLFVALGGTSYASVRLPQSAASPQALRSAKAGITCGGSCPASTVYWAYVGVGGGPGHVACAPNSSLCFPSPGVYDTAVGGVPATVTRQGVGDWLVRFQGEPLWNCARFANLTHDRGSASVAGWDHLNPDPAAIHVMTTDATGQPADLDFVVIAVCGKAPGIQFGSAPPATG